MKKLLPKIATIGFGVATWYAISTWKEPVESTETASNHVKSIPEPKSLAKVDEPAKKEIVVPQKQNKPVPLQKNTEETAKKAVGSRVVEEFHPQRRVIDHPKYGLIVQLVYPRGMIRYELPGPDDTHATHEYREDVIYEN